MWTRIPKTENRSATRRVHLNYISKISTLWVTRLSAGTGPGEEVGAGIDGWPGVKGRVSSCARVHPLTAPRALHYWQWTRKVASQFVSASVVHWNRKLLSSSLDGFSEWDWNMEIRYIAASSCYTFFSESLTLPLLWLNVQQGGLPRLALPCNSIETFMPDMIVDRRAFSPGCTKETTHRMRIPLHKLKYSHNLVDTGQIRNFQ